jgi:hypothetical protein
MKETGILFKPVLIKSILKDIKTETRRTQGLDEINKNPDAWEYKGYLSNKDTITVFFSNNGKTIRIKSPYGKSGDRLWVKETWAEIFNDIDLLHTDETHFEYKVDTGNKYPGEWPDDEGDDPECPRWKSPMFMPRRATRLILSIKQIRIERLHSISEKYAQKEGIPLQFSFDDKKTTNKKAGYSLTPGYIASSYRDAFHYFWEYINGPGSWQINPWVWVIKFKKELVCQPFDP